MHSQTIIRQIYFYPGYSKWLACLLVIGITILFSQATLLSPIQRHIHQTRMQEYELTQQYQNRYQRYINLRQLKQQQQILQQQISEKLPFLNHPLLLAETMSQVVQSIKSAGLQIITIKPGIMKQETGLHKLPLQLNLVGDEKSFLNWIWGTTQLPWLWNIQQCVLQKKAAAITITLKLDIYYA